MKNWLKAVGALGLVWGVGYIITLGLGKGLDWVTGKLFGEELGVVIIVACLVTWFAVDGIRHFKKRFDAEDTKGDDDHDACGNDCVACDEGRCGL